MGVGGGRDNWEKKKPKKVPWGGGDNEKKVEMHHSKVNQQNLGF